MLEAALGKCDCNTGRAGKANDFHLAMPHIHKAFQIELRLASIQFDANVPRVYPLYRRWYSWIINLKSGKWLFLVHLLN